MNDGTLRLGSHSAGIRLFWRPVFDVRNDDSLVRIGLATIGVHLFDDAFIQPEAGTSAGDHLVGGGLMLALLALFAGLYPRLHQAARGPPPGANCQPTNTPVATEYCQRLSPSIVASSGIRLSRAGRRAACCAYFPHRP